MKRPRDLTKRQGLELTVLCQGMREHTDVLNGRMDARKLILRVEKEYEGAEAVYQNEGPRAFLMYYQKAKEEIKINPLRVQICLLVQRDLDLTKPYPLLGEELDTTVDLKGKLHIFRLVQNRGNPDKKLKRPYPDEVKARAHEILERDGAESYPVLRRRKGMIAPDSLVNEISKSFKEEGFDVGPTRIRERLKEARFKMPIESVFARRS